MKTASMLWGGYKLFYTREKGYFIFSLYSKEVYIMKNNLHTVCFTGHRPEDINMSELQVKSLLRPAIETCIRKGATNFITGMSRGIDLWAADIVLELKKSHPDIQLFAAVPFHGRIFTAKWSHADKQHYASVLKQAAGVAYMAPEFSMKAYHTRNHFMVNHSDLVLACWNGKQSGGTYSTVCFANHQNKPLVNCFKRTEANKQTRIVKRETH
jgi:uncharacterized phage-like protein YoqJ